MLIEFTVGNYRSFKEPVTFSMVASKLTSEDPELDANTVFETETGVKLLTSAAVYGANASGKSNLVKALEFMHDMIVSSAKDTQVGEDILVEPFMLSIDQRNEPSLFEIVFIVNGRQYRYGFLVDNRYIHHEWLYHTPNTKERLLFERVGQNIDISQKTFAEGKGLEHRARENALFLSLCAQFNGSISVSIIDWFNNSTINKGLHDSISKAFTSKMMTIAEDYSGFIQNLISVLDTGIDSIDIEAIEPEKNFFSSPPTVYTTHKMHSSTDEGERYIQFVLERHESEGTKKLYSLAGLILYAIRCGSIIIIDEYDARLHPLISREIIRLFNNKETNPKHAQLIVMTHDTNLLDRSLLRRDQIWFIEKDRYGASHLYSLAEFKVRKDASFERDYIRGKYGAIPFIGDLRQVLEDAGGTKTA